MERQLLFLLDFDLTITEPELMHHFAPFLPRVTSKPRPRTRPPPSSSAIPLRDVACETVRIPARRKSNEQLATPPTSRRRISPRVDPLASQVSPTDSLSSVSTASPITPLDDVSPRALLPPIHVVAPVPYPLHDLHPARPLGRPASLIRSAFSKHLGRRTSAPAFTTFEDHEHSLV